MNWLRLPKTSCSISPPTMRPWPVEYLLHEFDVSLFIDVHSYSIPEHWQQHSRKSEMLQLRPMHISPTRSMRSWPSPKMIVSLLSPLLPSSPYVVPMILRTPSYLRSRPTLAIPASRIFRSSSICSRLVLKLVRVSAACVPVTNRSQRRFGENSTATIRAIIGPARSRPIQVSFAALFVQNWSRTQIQ